MRGISSVHNIVGLLIILDIEGLRVDHHSTRFDLLTDSVKWGVCIWMR